MAVNNVNYNDSLREGTDKINQSIDQSNNAIKKANEADTKADSAINTANQANTKSDETQQQLNNIVINNGESDAEVLQARGTYSVLNERLVATDEQLAEKATKKEMDIKIQSSFRFEVPTTQLDVRPEDFTKMAILTPFSINKEMKIDRVRLQVYGANQSALFEVGIYDEAMNLLSTSEVRQIGNNQQNSRIEVALPPQVLSSGNYYVAFARRNSVTMSVLTSRTLCYTTELTSAGLPTNITSAREYDYSPVFTLLGDDLLTPEGVEYYESEIPIRIYGKDKSTGKVYGWNTETGRICRSVTSTTFEDLMLLPSATLMQDGIIFDLQVVQGRLYLLTGDGILLRTSDLTSGATWEDISCPTTIRRSHALARPYGIQEFNGYLFQGEYSSTANGELVGGPKVFKLNLSTGTWFLSKQFANARHIHSFYSPGSSMLWVSVGDANFGSDVGMHRLTSVNGDGLDTWTKWTSLTSPNTDHYPVDFIYTNEGIYATSDRPGKHLLYVPTSGTIGGFNVNALLFRQNDETGETARSMVMDNNNNIYYWTAETGKPSVYVSPPPYTRTFKIKEFSTSLFLPRSELSGDGEYVYMYNQRIKTVKFPIENLSVPQQLPTLIARDYFYNNGFEKVLLTHNGVGQGVKGERTLYLETSSIVGGSSKSTFYFQRDVTNDKYIYADVEFGLGSSGNTLARLSANDSSGADNYGSNQVTHNNPNNYNGLTQRMALDVSTITGNKYIHIQAISSQEATIKMKVHRIWIV